MGGGDTIAAIATAPGRGGVAVVRVSGDGAMAIGERLSGSALRPGRIHFRTVSSPAERGGAPSVLDRCVVLAFAAPRSYTGEDVVEFQCHGGSVTPRRILDACFAAGARLARRGEFTERAFLNGRLDLSAAEAVIELVDARTDRAADDALARLGGAPARAYRALYDAALAVSAELEHALDVDEGELPPDFASAVRARLAALDRDLASALARAAGGRLLREGALVVLAGPPNAGKSSLMNALLGERRAIVSATPGTTRDSIEEGLDLGGWPVRLTDTAGLRGTDDAIEAEGVERTRELLARADVVVALSEATEGSVPIPVGGSVPVAGGSVPVAEGSVPVEGSVPGGGAEVIRVRSKCDLADDAKDAGDGWLRVSAVTGEGLDALRAALVAALERRAGAASDGEATPSERERSLLAAARLRLAEGAETDDPVLLANSARACAETLGALAGTVYSDDLLEALFSRFCVGK